MAQDAILCHVRALHKDGEEIPDAPLQAKLGPLTGSSDFRVLLPLPSSETAAHTGSLSGVLRDGSCRLSPKDSDNGLVASTAEAARGVRLTRTFEPAGEPLRRKEHQTRQQCQTRAFASQRWLGL